MAEKSGLSGFSALAWKTLESLSPTQIPWFLTLSVSIVATWLSTLYFPGFYWMGVGLPILIIVAVSARLALRSQPPPDRNSSSDIRFAIVFGITVAVAFLILFGRESLNRPAIFSVTILACVVHAAVFLAFGLTDVRHKVKEVSFDYLQLSLISATVLGAATELLREASMPFILNVPKGTSESISGLLSAKTNNSPNALGASLFLYAVWGWTLAIWIRELCVQKRVNGSTSLFIRSLERTATMAIADSDDTVRRYLLALGTLAVLSCGPSLSRIDLRDHEREAAMAAAKPKLVQEPAPGQDSSQVLSGRLFDFDAKLDLQARELDGLRRALSSQQTVHREETNSLAFELRGLKSGVEQLQSYTEVISRGLTELGASVTNESAMGKEVIADIYSQISKLQQRVDTYQAPRPPMPQERLGPPSQSPIEVKPSVWLPGEDLELRENHEKTILGPDYMVAHGTVTQGIIFTHEIPKISVVNTATGDTLVEKVVKPGDALDFTVTGPESLKGKYRIVILSISAGPVKMRLIKRK